MATQSEFPVAKKGDKLLQAELKLSASKLIDMASDLTKRLTVAQTPAEVQALKDSHTELINLALDLTNQDVELLTGQAKVSGTAILAAIAKADDTIKTIAKIKKELAVVAKVLTLVQAVLTGGGTAIVAAIKDLNSDDKKT